MTIPPRPPGAARVVAIGDPHLEGSRFAADLPLWDAIIDGVAEAAPDLTLLAGDLVGGHDTNHVTTVEERAALDPRWRRLTATSPVHIIRGNHDEPRDFKRLEALRGRHELRAHDRPGLHRLTLAGRPAVLAVLPYPDKGTILAGRVPGSHAEESDIISEWLRSRLTAMGGAIAQLKKADPTTLAILLGHVSISGSTPGGSEIYMPGDGAISPADVEAFGADLSLFGHIHAPQTIGAHAYILGSLRELGHGEGGDGRWWCVFDIHPGGAVDVHRIPTGWRPKRTARGRWDGAAITWAERPDHKGADLRILIESDPEHEASIPREALLAEAITTSAASVRVEKRTTRKPQIIRAPGLERAATDLERLRAVAPSLGEEIDDARAVRLGRIIEGHATLDPVADLAAAFPGVINGGV